MFGPSPTVQSATVFIPVLHIQDDFQIPLNAPQAHVNRGKLQHGIKYVFVSEHFNLNYKNCRLFLEVVGGPENLKYNS